MEYPLTFRLLLACLNGDLEQFKTVRSAGVSAAHWQEFVSLSQVQGVTPLVYQRLIKLSEMPDIPGEILEQLREIYLQNLKRNMRLYQNLEQILSELSRQHIPVIPLKGVFLAEKIYGNIGIRPMVDVDILLPPPDLPQAVRILDSLGYRSKYPFDIEQECRTQHHLPQLFRPGSVKLELHWTLAPANTPFHIDVQKLWDDSFPSTLTGIEIRAMQPEDLLLYLCLHAAFMDNFSSRLRPYCDIAWTIWHFKDSLDWERFNNQAEAWGAVRSAWLALRITKELLGIELSPAVNEHLKPAGYNLLLENLAVEQILAPSTIGPKLAAAWEPQPWGRRLTHIIRGLLPPRWEMRQNYPDMTHGWSWLMAYARHVVSVIQHNWRTTWRLMRSDRSLKTALEQRQRGNLLIEWQAGKTGGIK